MSIQSEKSTVAKMIHLYCKGIHKQDMLCADCQVILTYAHSKLDACVYGNLKTKCKKCPTHCYAKQQREKIRQIMRYAGPRFLFYHPLDYLKHLIN